VALAPFFAIRAISCRKTWRWRGALINSMGRSADFSDRISWGGSTAHAQSVILIPVMGVSLAIAAVCSPFHQHEK
jgi:hypothetical protein